jgi:hypothetical protein
LRHRRERLPALPRGADDQCLGARAEFKRAAFEAMRAKYQVILPARPVEEAAAEKDAP